MKTVFARVEAYRLPARCSDGIIASVESFTGAPRAGDLLMLMLRNPNVTSRLGQAVLLREEIDAGTLHWVMPVRHGDLARLMAKISGTRFLALRMDERAFCSGVPVRAGAMSAA